MSLATTPTLAPADLAAVFSRMILIGADLVEDLPNLPDDSKRNPAADYATLTRSMRQSALMLERLAEAPKAVDPATRRKSACERVIRGVEDGIAQHAKGRDPEALRAELRERLASPDFLEKLDTETPEHLIAGLKHDLHLCGSFNGTYARRTPADAAALRAAIAAALEPLAPPGPAPSPLHRAPLDRPDLAHSGIPAAHRPEAHSHDLR